MWELKGIFAVLLAWFLGLDLAYKCLAVLMVLDMAVALGRAIVLRTLDRRVAFLGVLKKALVWMVVSACAAMTIFFRESFGASVPAGPAVACLFCGHEFVSILTNAREAGVWLPKPLIQALEAFEAQFDGPPVK